MLFVSNFWREHWYNWFRVIVQYNMVKYFLVWDLNVELKMYGICCFYGRHCLINIYIYTWIQPRGKQLKRWPCGPWKGTTAPFMYVMKIITMIMYMYDGHFCVNLKPLEFSTFCVNWDGIMNWQLMLLNEWELNVALEWYNSKAIPFLKRIIHVHILYTIKI